MVVIAAPITTIETRLVAEVANIGTDSFDLRVRSIDGAEFDPVDVSWFAINAGTHSRSRRLASASRRSGRADRSATHPQPARRSR